MHESKLSTESGQFRSRSSAKGKDSEYENMESDFAEDDDEKIPIVLNKSRDSEQREIDEFEEEERRLLAEDAKVSSLYLNIYVAVRKNYE
jgi:hypothetical protein